MRGPTFAEATLWTNIHLQPEHMQRLWNGVGSMYESPLHCRNRSQCAPEEVEYREAKLRRDARVAQLAFLRTHAFRLVYGFRSFLVPYTLMMLSD